MTRVARNRFISGGRPCSALTSSIKRFTRLTYAFSKKLENLAAVAIHVAVYNFVRMHGSLKMTPAMAAGVIDKHWKMEDLYDAVMEQAERKRKAARINRLIAKLREQ